MLSCTYRTKRVTVEDGAVIVDGLPDMSEQLTTLGLLWAKRAGSERFVTADGRDFDPELIVGNVVMLMWLVAFYELPGFEFVDDAVSPDFVY